MGKKNVRIERIDTDLWQFRALGDFWAYSPEVETRIRPSGHGNSWMLVTWRGDARVADTLFRGTARHAYKVASRYTRFHALPFEARAILSYYHGQPRPVRQRDGGA